jgi:hypothetical protein
MSWLATAYVLLAMLTLVVGAYTMARVAQIRAEATLTTCRMWIEAGRPELCIP